MKLVKLISILALMLTFLNAEPISQKGEKNGYMITLTSQKSLVVGDNNMSVQLSKDGKTVTNVKTKIKFFMPEMPGMPYMDYKAKGKLSADKYNFLINFSMGGTWQYQLKFKDTDGKIHTLRGSVNL